MSAAELIVHEGDPEFERWIAARVKVVTRTRGYYMAARRALRQVISYKVEDVLARRPWRDDHRILALLGYVRWCRAEIRKIRAAAGRPS